MNGMRIQITNQITSLDVMTNMLQHRDMCRQDQAVLADHCWLIHTFFPQATGRVHYVSVSADTQSQYV